MWQYRQKVENRYQVIRNKADWRNPVGFFIVFICRLEFEVSSEMNAGDYPSFSIDKRKVMCYFKYSNILPIGGHNEFKGSN